MIPFDDEVATLHGSLGRRSLYGRGTHGRGSRRSVRRARVYPSLDDMYVGTGRGYNVIEERMPRSEAVRAFQVYE